jgi:hypothetical protein
MYLKPSEGHDDFLDAHGAADRGVSELRYAARVGGEAEGDV